MSRLFENIRGLSEISGPSGHETQVIEYIASRLHTAARTVEIDTTGNLLVQLGNSNGPTYMVSAHTDEVGLVVRTVDPAGNVLFEKLGLVDDRVLPAREVVILAPSGPIPGVIGIKGKHLLTPDDLAKPLESRAMWIETGLSTAELSHAGVRAGTTVAFNTRFKRLGNHLILGKSLDCRTGCAVIMEVLHRLHESDSHVLKSVNVAAAFTVQEEIGAKGAATVAYGLNPRLAIVLDTVPCEGPIVPPELQSVLLGKGPVVRTFDYFAQTMYGCWSHPDLVKIITTAGDKAEIPYQVDIMTSTFLDSSTLQSTGPGIPTASICIPRRYSHSPVEVCNMKDIENTAELLVAVLEDIPPNMKFGRRLK